MKKLNKILPLILCLLLFFNISITSYAAANISALKNGGYNQLSMQDKQDTIEAMIKKIAKDAGVKLPIQVSCYEWPGSANLAYSYTMKYYHQICVNLSHFENDADAAFAGVTVEYHLVNALAHEVRHCYQWEHENDDTDYGRAVKASDESYQSYDNAGYEAYYYQFVEEDARAYGEAYADKYVKNGKLNIITSDPVVLITNDGKIFDPVFYANTYPDVKNALGTDPRVLIEHYNTFGMYEGRKVSANDK